MVKTVELYVDYTTENLEPLVANVFIDYIETDEGKEIKNVLISEWVSNKDLRHVDGLARLFFHENGIVCTFDSVKKKPLTLFASKREAEKEAKILNRNTAIDWNGLKRFTVCDFSEV